MQTSQIGDTVDTLFGVDVQYQVPRYQRRYVWNEANWRALWEDIRHQFGLELRGREETHFTGPFVTKPITSGRQLSRLEVIDGQQRLATFQIILCVIRDICLSQDSDELTQLANEVEKLIVNADGVIRRNTPGDFPDPTYKFRPTDYDRSAFDAVAEGEYGKVIPQAFDEAENRLKPDLVEKARSQVFCGSNVSINILDAYDYFYVQIRGYVGVNYDYDTVDKLISSIKSDFELVQITLDSSDQSEKIFESLNATGRMLSEFDYLRNHLFLRAGKLREDNNGRAYSDIFYNKYWIFENDSQYWDADKLDSFFRAFLVAKLGPYCFKSKSTKPFELYREYSGSLTIKQKIEYEFEQLSAYAKSYKEINYKMNESTSEIRHHMQFYDHLKLPRLDSFILFVKHKLGNESTNCVCDILESYIVRCMLCHSDNKHCYETINTFFSKAITDCEFRIEDFATILLKSEPDDNQIMDAFKQVGSKDAEFISYIFRRIENWKKEETTLWGYTPLNLEDQITLLSAIQNNLEEINEDESKLATLKRVFNEVWAPTEVLFKILEF